MTKKETMSTIENYAGGDAIQFMVSTNGKIIYGKNRGLGWRTRQVGGYVSDTSLRQLSQDILSNNIQGTGDDNLSFRGNTSSSFNDSIGGGLELESKGQHPGPKFTPMSTPNPRSSSQPEYGYVELALPNGRAYR